MWPWRESHVDCFWLSFHLTLHQSESWRSNEHKWNLNQQSKKENLPSELSGIFFPLSPSWVYQGSCWKHSPPSHKLARRFISLQTWSLRMLPPAGTWASVLWRNLTGLLLGTAVVENCSLLPCPSVSHSIFSLSLNLSSPLWNLSQSNDSHLKGKGQSSHLSLHLINLAFLPLYHIHDPRRRPRKNGYYDRWWMALSLVG